MAAPPQPPWADLPAGLLADIALHLRCLADRIQMSKVCRSWRDAITHQPPPPHLPWLLLPYGTTGPVPPDGVRTAAFFCALGSDTHHLRIGNDTGGARFFGSYEGGWLFLAHLRAHRYALVNRRTDQRFLLPDSVLWRGEQHLPQPLPMVILAATLSSSPVPGGQCIAAAIVDTLQCSSSMTRPPQFAFWRLEDGDQAVDQVASGFIYNFPLDNSGLEDVIHYNGAFHFLNHGEHVVVCTVTFQEEEGLVVHDQYRYTVRPRCSNDLHVTARYLVESRGELLMVARCSPYPGSPTISAFMVYQMTPEQVHGAVMLPSWTKLPTLDGRMLFVARGCSRSYEVADFPGFEDSVYFLDDKNSDDVAMMMLQDQNHLYGCTASTPAETTEGGRQRRLAACTAGFLPRTHRTTRLRFGFSLETTCKQV